MKSNAWLLRPMVLAVSSCFGMSAWGNPLGPQVVQGNATFQGLGTNSLQVRNAPGTVINWQGFSIGQGQLTNFIQQNASSAVLNRVVGGDISQIHGTLQSNGRVFLINPAGIVVGSTGIIDTAGFVGSTLNMLDADFLAGRLRFQGDPNAGGITNQGTIRTSFGGSIVLIAPHIENGKDALIQTPGGELILAAGQKVTIGTLDANGVQFEVQAPGDSVVNLGKLIAEGGAVGVFAGTLKHSGDIRADALVRDAAGRIVLKGRDTVTVAGSVSATSAAGRGGDIQVLGDRVNVLAGGTIDVSGAAGGGRLLIGGDYQGGNRNVPNASRTFVAQGANLFADATSQGDGGRIIVWADKSTRYDGNLFARGGPLGGNGGFAEVSGKENLVFTGFANLSAPRGALGTLLLDPLDLYVSATGGLNPDIIDEAGDFPNNAVTVSPDTLAKIPGNVTLFASRYMRFNDAVNLTTAGQTFTAQVGRVTNTDFPGTTSDLFPSNGLINGMDIGASITTNGGAVSLTAPTIRSFGSSLISITTGGAAITLSPTAASTPTPLLVQAGLLNLNAGTGVVTINQGGNVQVRDITSAPLTINVTGSLSTGAITSTGAVDLTGASVSTGAIGAGGLVNLTANTGSIFTGVVTANGAITEIAPGTISNSSLASGGGAVSLMGSGTSAPSISTGNITAGAGAVTLSGRSIFTGTIDTTAAVSLTASAGSIFATVDNAASVVANATSAGSLSVQVSSSTALNANNVSAIATGCTGFTVCSSANVALSGANGVNVGTVKAESPIHPVTNNRNNSVTISSSRGSVVGMAADSQVTATDVTLGTNTGSGGGIRGAGSGALNVSAERRFTFAPNGAFNVNLNGTGPNVLSVAPGLAATGSSYTGTLARQGAGTWLDVSASDALVTVNSFAPTGFNDRVYNIEPAIALSVPNGDLRAVSVIAPQGDTRPSDPLVPFTTASLPVMISASGNVTIDSYTREATAASLAKSTTIRSDGFGSVTLGSINANKDSVDVFGPGGVTISSSTLTSTGPISVSSTFGTINGGRIVGGSSVSLSSDSGTINTGQITSADSTSVTSDSGSIFVGRIDATGAVTLNSAFGAIGASAEGATLEVVSAASIDASAPTIGRAGFANPLDLQAPAITLSSTGSGGRIGFLDPATPAAPVVALTPDLTINAASAGLPGGSFNVSTGSTALKNLTIFASSSGASVTPGSGPRQASRVTSEAKTYTFDGFGGELVVDIGTVPDAGTPSQTQFVNGTLAVTNNLGNLRIASNTNMGAGGLTAEAQRGSVLSDAATFDGRALDLRAGTAGLLAPSTSVVVSTAAIGTTIAPESVTLRAGRAAGDSLPAVTGSVQTSGDVVASAVTMEAFNGSIRVGPTGTGAIGSAASRGAINLTLNRSTLDPAASIRTGNITGSNVNGTNIANAIVTGNIDATGDVVLKSRESVTTGNIDAGTILITDDQLITTTITTVGAIGQTRAPTRATLIGAPLTIGGAVTGAAGSTLGFFSNGRGSAVGTTTISGPITAGDGSTITILSRRDFDFTRIDAGAGESSVSVTADTGSIRQTAGGAGGGITAKTIFVSAPDAITKTAAGGTDPVDLFGVTNLTARATGRATFDAHASTLERLSVNKGPIGPTTPFGVSNLGSGQTVSVTGGPDITLVVDSPTSPLNFELNYIGGAITLAGLGIRTSGGDATVTSNGTFTGLTDTSPTGLTGNGIHTAGGAVVLRAPSIVTGTIDTRPGIGASGGGIDINTNFGTNILVSGDLRTGETGGAIVIGTGGGSITRSGTETIQSGTRADVRASGDIGAAGNRLVIEAPTVVLAAAGTGTAFAQLTGTNNLDLRGDHGFNVSSDTAFNTLTVSSSATGAGTAAAGTLNLTAPGQTFDFAHPGTAFQVVRADLGASQPDANRATFTTSAGDLLIFGGTSSTPSLINVPNLDLFAAQDVRLEGDAANRLVLTNALQNFRPTRDLLITGNAAITATAPGSAAPSGTAAQIFRPGRDIVVQAQGGSIAIDAPTQDFTALNGNISFLGGSGADDAVTVTGSVNQFISTAQGAARNIVLGAGSGARSNVSVVYSGGANVSPSGDGNLADQRIEAGGDVRVLGGSGADAIGEIRTGAGRQQVRADGTVLVAGGAGTGARARILHSGTADHAQQIGESRLTGGLDPVPFPYQTDAIEVRGGTNTDATAEITSSARQQVFVQNLSGTPGSAGTLKVLGGSGAGTTARIDSTGTTEQEIGLPNYLVDRPGFRMGDITVEAGTGVGSAVRITSAASQRVTTSSDFGAPGALAVRGMATDASASLTGAGQDIRVKGLTVEAGAGNNANALVQSSTTQTIQHSGVNVFGGGGAGATATAQILAAENQAIQQFFSANSVVRGGAGANSFARINTPATQTLSFSNLRVAGGDGAGAFARVDSGADQRLSLSTMTIAGGAGTDAFGKIDAATSQAGTFGSGNIGVASLTGGGGTGAYAAFESGTLQSLGYSSLTLQGGTATSTPARFVAATTQSLSGGNITLQAGGNADTAVADAGALLEGRSQFFSGFGAVMVNGGAGVAGSTSDAIIRNLAGNQTLNAGSVTVRSGLRNSLGAIVNAGDGTQMLSASSGIAVAGRSADTTANAMIQNVPATTQTLSASFGGITIANTGAGEARIISAAAQSTTSQFLHVTTDSTGLSSLSASGNQRVVTTNGGVAAAGGRSLRVAGIGSGTASIVSGATQLFEIDYPGVMTTVFGTPPPGSFVIGDTTSTGTSLIQGNNQFIFAGSATIQSGSGSASSAKLDAAGTQVVSTLPGGITIASGSGAGSSASIDPESQSLVSNGPMTLNAVGGPVTLVSNGPQNIIVTNGPLTVGGSSSAAASSIFTSGTPDQQVIIASGGVTILPFGSIGASPAGASAGALASSASTNQLVRTQDELERTQSEFERLLEEAEAEDRRSRRGIGACQ